MHTVFLNENIHQDAYDELIRKYKVVNNFDNPEEIEAIIVRTFKVDREVLDKCTNLKIIAKHGVGMDTIDLQEAKNRGIKAINTPNANANSVAELIIGLILDSCRNISKAHEKSIKGEFDSIAPQSMTGIEISNKTLGLIGFGNIARIVARICKNGFNMKLVAYDPFVSREQMEGCECEKFETVDEVVSISDVINVSVPLNPSTQDLISDRQFDLMKKNAILVNAARGGVVNENALYEALKNKKIFSAACDAFVIEPPTSENTNLYKLDNFIGTPHIGACSEEALIRMGKEVVKNLDNFFVEVK